MCKYDVRRLSNRGNTYLIYGCPSLKHSPPARPSPPLPPPLPPLPPPPVSQQPRSLQRHYKQHNNIRKARNELALSLLSYLPRGRGAGNNGPAIILLLTKCHTYTPPRPPSPPPWPTATMLWAVGYARGQLCSGGCRPDCPRANIYHTKRWSRPKMAPKHETE